MTDNKIIVQRMYFRAVCDAQGRFVALKCSSEIYELRHKPPEGLQYFGRIWAEYKNKHEEELKNG